MARYRWPTVVTAASGLVLAAFTLWWIFIAYADYRSPDFTKVSKGVVDGTCVEAASVDQLKSMWLDNKDWNCNDNAKTDLANLLAVSVHAMYSANAATPYTGDAKAVYDAVIAATQGTDSGYKISRANAYAALSIVGTPSTTDCAALYGVATEGASPTSRCPSSATRTSRPPTRRPMWSPTGAPLHALRVPVQLREVVPGAGHARHPQGWRGGFARHPPSSPPTAPPIGKTAHASSSARAGATRPCSTRSRCWRRHSSSWTRPCSSLPS